MAVLGGKRCELSCAASRSVTSSMLLRAERERTGRGHAGACCRERCRNGGGWQCARHGEQGLCDWGGRDGHGGRLQGCQGRADGIGQEEGDRARVM